MGKTSLLLLFCLLFGLSAPAQPAPEPSLAENADPYGWMRDYEDSQYYSTLADFEHIPLDQLPQDLRDSLTLAEEGERDYYGENSHWGYWRTYTAPGLVIETSAPTAAYLEELGKRFRESGSVWVGGEETYETREQFLFGTQGEEDQEWIYRVEITRPDYATLEGLRVGLTVEEAEKLGYPLSQRLSFGGGLTGNLLEVTVENGVVTRLEGAFGMGRYIGKFWEQ